MFISMANEYQPPPPPPDGWEQWIVFALLVLLLCIGLAMGRDVLADDAKHPCYAAPIQDCIDLIQHEGTPAYCAWAGAMAGYGAYLRELGLPEADLKTKIVMPRKPTAKEYAHIMAWMRFGWLVQKAPYEAANAARDACMTASGALPTGAKLKDLDSY